MRQKLLVREVTMQRGCGGFRREDPDIEPTVVCPLCVSEGKCRPHERTATVIQSGHIWCNRGCGRYATIIMAVSLGAEVSLYPTSLGDVRTFSQQTAALGLLRSALAGDGNLDDLVSVDEQRPHTEFRFVLDRIRVNELAIAEVAFR